MTKIKCYKYLRLSEAEQYDAVWSLGALVDSDIKDDIAINLYVINDFYCEPCDSMKTNKILYKQSFKPGIRLNKAFFKINI
jgi:hypothetical protein